MDASQGQVRRCWEVFKLGSLDAGDAKALREYRLAIKRRLLKLHSQEMAEAGEERKKRLDDRYRQLEASYLRLLQRLREDG